MNPGGIINSRIIEKQPIGGGDIGSNYRIKTDDGIYFVKYYKNEGTAAAEALGLAEMAAACAVSLPKLIGYDEHHLVLEFIKSAPKIKGFQQRLGTDLARMHRRSAESGTKGFGFKQDNFIGLTVQKNEWKPRWTDFFIENRIDFQVKLCCDSAVSDIWSRLRPRVPDILSGTEEPASLIHGDLWAGNVISGRYGEPVLIDPAAYYGHREMELGMTMLFGGFSSEFYAAYDKEYPLKDGWRGRMDLYKLYHVLNHMNMFGGGYRSHAISLMKHYL